MVRTLLAVCAMTFSATAAETKSLFDLEPVKVAAADTAMKKLLKDRYNTALEELQLSSKSLEAGNWDVNSLAGMLDTATTLREAYMELSTSKEDNVTWLTSYVALANDFEACMQKGFKTGSLRKMELLKTTGFRLDAEIALEKMKETK